MAMRGSASARIQHWRSNIKSRVENNRMQQNIDDNDEENNDEENHNCIRKIMSHFSDRHPLWSNLAKFLNY